MEISAFVLGKDPSLTVNSRSGTIPLPLAGACSAVGSALQSH